MADIPSYTEYSTDSKHSIELDTVYNHPTRTAALHVFISGTHVILSGGTVIW
jgi:hypothetical protein